MIIERNSYLKKLIAKRHDGKIKIVTGFVVAVNLSYSRPFMQIGLENMALTIHT